MCVFMVFSFCNCHFDHREKSYCGLHCYTSLLFWTIGEIAVVILSAAKNLVLLALILPLDASLRQHDEFIENIVLIP